MESLALDQMRTLCEPLHIALSHGVERAAAIMASEKLTSPDFDWLRHHHARAAAHVKLCEMRDEVAPWQVSRHKPNNGPFHLIQGGMTIRVCHGIDGGVPAPGKNKARRNFYAQPMLDVIDDDVLLEGLKVSNYVATWEVADVATHEVAIRMFRPVGTFKYGSKAKVDAAFWLPDDAKDLDSLIFEPSDQGIELMIPGEEQSGEQPLRG